MPYSKQLIIGGVILLLILAAVLYIPRTTQEDGRTVITISAPSDGLLAPPLLRMIDTEPLKEKGIDLEFISWRSQEQLRAFVLNEQVDILGIHLAGAANFYNRGIPIRFLGASLGNVLFVISRDESISNFSDLEGRRVIIPFKGEYPDIFFQGLYTAYTEKYPEFSLSVQYAQSSRDAANMMFHGRADAALIAEPHASILLERNKEEYYRSLDFQDVWTEIFDQDHSFPVAGIAALGDTAFNNEVLSLFWEEYLKAMEWCITHPELAAGLIGNIEDDADALTGTSRAFERCARIPVSSNEERPHISIYLQILNEADPELFTGIPENNDFYWNPNYRSTF